MCLQRFHVITQSPCMLVVVYQLLGLGTQCAQNEHEDRQGKRFGGMQP
jgi:hypothetical protein